MRDLLYNAAGLEDEILSILPDAVIEDASDETHPGRLSITTDIQDEEYYKLIFLNGFGHFSLGLTMYLIPDHNYVSFLSKIAGWRKEYPHLFKN